MEGGLQRRNLEFIVRELYGLIESLWLPKTRMWELIPSVMVSGGGALVR